MRSTRRPAPLRLPTAYSWVCTALWSRSCHSRAQGWCTLPSTIACCVDHWQCKPHGVSELSSECSSHSFACHWSMSLWGFCERLSPYATESVGICVFRVAADEADDAHALWWPELCLGTIVIHVFLRRKYDAPICWCAVLDACGQNVMHLSVIAFAPPRQRQADVCWAKRFYWCQEHAWSLCGVSHYAFVRVPLYHRHRQTQFVVVVTALVSCRTVTVTSSSCPDVLLY